MAISCGQLSSGIIGVDCANPLVPGVKPRAILINRDDIDIAKTDIKNGVMTKIVFKDPSNKGFLATTLENGIDANIAFAKGAYYNGWDHNFVFRIFDNSPKVKNFIDQVSKSRMMVIIENNFVKYGLKDTLDASKSSDPTSDNYEELKGETVYEVYGFYVGLELKEATRDTKDADTKGGWVLTCGCNDSAKEPALPITLFDTDLASTKTLVEGLY